MTTDHARMGARRIDRWHAFGRPGQFLLLLVTVPVSLAVGMTVAMEWRELLHLGTFAAIVGIALVDLFPVPTWRGFRFSLSDPLFVASALVFEPLHALAIGFVAATDPGEFRRELPLFRAVFNRAQCGLAVCLASLAFHALSTADSSWESLLPSALAATSVFYLVNVFLVALAGSFGFDVPVRRALRELFLRAPGEWTGSFVSFGVLGSIIARVYVSTPHGEWVFVVSVVPVLLLARREFLYFQRLQRESDRLRDREAAFRKLSEQITDERHDERTQIASALHDEVIPLLQSSHLLARAARNEATFPAGPSEVLNTLAAHMQEALTLVRGVASELRRSPLGRSGLSGSLAKLVSSLGEGSGIQSTVDIDADGLSETEQLLAFQIAREALANAVQHASAARVSVILHRESKRGFVLRIVDDGSGFDPDGDFPNHLGLVLMRERARALGGELRIVSIPGKGTCVQVAWKPRTPASEERTEQSVETADRLKQPRSGSSLSGWGVSG